MNWTLAVDTSLSRAQLALFKDQVFIDDTKWQKQKSHSEVLTGAFQDLLAKNHIKLNNIKKVACVVGPGSFTGIRVGLNFAKTLAYSLDAPCFELNKLRLQIAGAKNLPQEMVSVMDAQKNSLFVSYFSNHDETLTAELENQVVPISDLHKVIQRPVTVFGEGLENYQRFLDKNLANKLNFNNHVSDLKFMFDDIVVNRREKRWFEVQPLYIKASAPEEKLSPTQIKI